MTGNGRWRFAYMATLGLVLSTLHCDSPMAVSEGPLVRLHLTGLDAMTTRLLLQVTAKDATSKDQTRTQEFSGSGPFDTLGVTFPQGTKGVSTFHVDIFKGANCLLGSGMAMLTLLDDSTVDLTLQLTPPTMTCGTPTPKLTVEVITGLGGAGMVTSQPAGINCTAAGTSCANTYTQAQQVTLHGQSTMGTFVGFSGGGCSGTNDCVVTLTQDTVVQAIFKKSTCSGFCSEMSPTTQTLLGINGTSPNNIVAVGTNGGSGGTIIKWDGTQWMTQSSGVMANLNAVTVPPGDKTIIIVGDSGYVLSQAPSTQVWSRIPQIGGLPNLFGISGARADEMFIVGTNGTYAKGSVTAGFTSLNQSAVSGKTLNAISARASDGEHYLVGNSGFAYRRFLSNGTETFAAQVTATTSSLYGTWSGNNVVYAVGNTGTIIKRTPGGGASTAENTWVPVTTGISNSNAMYSVWGSSDNDIYIVGQSGTILHYDGTSWSTIPSNTTQTLVAVWGTGSNNIYAVGANGTILHYLP